MARLKADVGESEDGSPSGLGQVAHRRGPGSFTPDQTAVAWPRSILPTLTDSPVATSRRRPPGPAAEHLAGPTDHGCASLADVGHTAFSDYTADYFFYRTNKNADQDVPTNALVRDSQNRVRARAGSAARGISMDTRLRSTSPQIGSIVECPRPTPSPVALCGRL
jgi:hypothetical protein